MSREIILAFVNKNGPVIPSQIAKELKTSILFASAMLSELVARKELKVSSVKIGGSPLYLIPGQEVQLEKYTDKLNDKEFQAFKLIQEKKIIRDRAETPLTRVTLRTIKDFAIPLEVSFNNQTEIFWRWYQLDNKLAEQAIRQILHGKTPFKETKELVQKESQELKQPILEAQKETSKITQQPKPIVKREKKSIIRKSTSSFEHDFQQFLTSSKCNTRDKVAKKNGESEGILEFESPVGKVQFYYLAKNKKSVTDKDISEAYAQGQMKQLPVILFAPGELNKKGVQQLTQFKTVYFKMI